MSYRWGCRHPKDPHLLCKTWICFTPGTQWCYSWVGCFSSWHRPLGPQLNNWVDWSKFLAQGNNINTKVATLGIKSGVFWLPGQCLSHSTQTHYTNMHAPKHTHTHTPTRLRTRTHTLHTTQHGHACIPTHTYTSTCTYIPHFIWQAIDCTTLSKHFLTKYWNYTNKSAQM